MNPARWERIKQLFAAASNRPAEQRSAYRAQPGYLGSSRFYRGRIVDRLRALRSEECLGVDELGPAVRTDFGPEHRPWLLALLRTLAAEGLVLVESSGALGTCSDGEVKVRLP